MPSNCMTIILLRCRGDAFFEVAEATRRIPAAKGVSGSPVERVSARAGRAPGPAWARSA
jgi:hypothetical protein